MRALPWIGVGLVLVWGLVVAGCSRSGPPLESSGGEYQGTTGEADAVEAYQAAKGFLKDLGGNRLDAAHKRLTGPAPPFEAFRAEIAKYPPLKDQRTLSLHPVEPIRDGRGRFQGRIEDRDGLSVAVTIEVVKQDGAWKVARYQFRL
jgi:hypothetical protein